jgi:hypothetical protein
VGTGKEGGNITRVSFVVRFSFVVSGSFVVELSFVAGGSFAVAGSFVALLALLRKGETCGACGLKTLKNGEKRIPLFSVVASLFSSLSCHASSHFSSLYSEGCLFFFALCISLGSPPQFWGGLQRGHRDKSGFSLWGKGGFSY